MAKPLGDIQEKVGPIPTLSPMPQINKYFLASSIGLSCQQKTIIGLRYLLPFYKDKDIDWSVTILDENDTTGGFVSPMWYIRLKYATD